MELNGHTDSVNSVATTSDNKIASGSGDGSVRIWDGATGIQLLQIHDDAAESVWSVACALDEGASGPHGSKMIASNSSEKICLWDMSTGQRIAALHGHTNDVTSVAFSADGKTLISASWDDTVRLWDLSTRRPLRLLRGSSVSSAAISSNGKRIVSGDQEGFVRIWNL